MSIKETIKVNNEKSFQVIIRKKGVEICKTFSNLEDAKLFEFYRTSLVENMANYEIPLHERIRLEDIIDLKTKDIVDKRILCEFELSLKRIKNSIKPHAFVSELTYEDWEKCLETIIKLDIPARGNARTIIKMSPKSVRRIFATMSSAFSHARSKGIPIENYPLQLVQKKINPAIKSTPTK